MSKTTLREVVADLHAKISAGAEGYTHGSKLPAYRTRAEELGVSHQTVANAYARLATLGMVDVRGNGTYVIAGPQADAHLGTYGPPDITAAKPWRATGDGIETNELVLVRSVDGHVERHHVRKVDGVPAHHKVTSMPYEIAEKIPDGYTGVPPMLAPVGAPPVRPPHGVRMADWLGWDFSHTDTTITIDPVGDDSAKYLGLPVGTPAFHVASDWISNSGEKIGHTLTVAPLHHRLTMTTK